MGARKILTKMVGGCQRRLYSRDATIDHLIEQYSTTQWYKRATLKGYQKLKLRSLFAHCWFNVPYYRRIFEERDMRSPEDLSLERLPLLTKSIIRRQFDGLKTEDLDKRKCFMNYSGGSTGEPLALVQDEEYLIHSAAKKAVCFEWAGYSNGESLVRLWGSERDILEGGIGWKAHLASFLNNRIILNAFRMTPESMRRYLDLINRWQPEYIHAYASAIFELAKFAWRHGIQVNPPRAIVSTSGTLYPFMRETVERVFRCPIFDQYGSREVSCIASECERHQGLHVNMETMVLEVLDDKGQPCPPGIEGEIVITSLVNYAMPLLRYQIGDRGVLADHECSCGRGHVLLKQVVGRSMDCLRKEDGTIIPAEYFIHFLGVVFNRGWIEKFQVVQEAYQQVRINVVTEDRIPNPEELSELQRTVKLVMGDSCRVEIQFVEDIPPSDSGKYRYTICRVHEAGQ